MRTQPVDWNASDLAATAIADAAGPRTGAPSEDRPAAAPAWALAFGDSLPVIAGRGEGRSWPRVIP